MAMTNMKKANKPKNRITKTLTHEQIQPRKSRTHLPCWWLTGKLKWRVQLQSNDEMTSIICFLCKSQLKKDEDKEIFLIAKFLLN